MAQKWLRRLITGKEDQRPSLEKSRVWESDILGAGLPLTQPLSTGELMTAEYRGTLTNEQIGRIYSALPVARRCADIIAGTGSSVPLKMYYRPSQKGKWQIEEKKTPAPTLAWINRKMTHVDYVARLLYFLSLYENAYVAIEANTDPLDRRYSEYSLFPMNPTCVRLVPHEVMGTRWFEYKVGGHEPIYFPESNVMHIGGFSPFDNFYGLSKVNALDYDIQKERYAKKFLTQFFSNAATFSGVLTINGEGEEEIQKIRTQIEENYRGSTKAFRILVLEEGQEYEAVQSTGIEANSVPIIKDSNDMMQMVFGVPVGILTGESQDLEALQELFWTNTINPLLERIEQMHTKKFCLPIDPIRLKMQFDKRGVLALQRQRLTLAKIHVAYQNIGVTTPNETREEIGKDPHEGVNQSFGDIAKPVWDAILGQKMAEFSAANKPVAGDKPGGNPAQSGGTSPSLTLPGSQGGDRDQSDEGEAQLIDESGKKNLKSDDAFSDLIKAAGLED